MMKALRFGVIAAVAMLLSACGSLSLNTESASTKLVVRGATMKYIEREDGKEARAARAAQIIRAADDASVMLDMQGVTVADLKAKMLERIAKADLEPSDKLILTGLVDAVNIELTAQVGAGAISPDDRATVNAVLGWVKQAASFFG